jgi:hypothetical protein
LLLIAKTEAYLETTFKSLRFGKVLPSTRHFNTKSPLSLLTGVASGEAGSTLNPNATPAATAAEKQIPISFGPVSLSGALSIN